MAAMSCGREMTESINPYSTASSAPMKKSLSVSCTIPGIRVSSRATQELVHLQARMRLQEELQPL